MILVTGGTGLVGSHLLKELVSNGAKVRALKRPDSNMSLVATIQDQVEWFKGNVTDVISLQEAMQGISQIYHCAAVVSFSPAQRQNMFNVNVSGTANVVNLALENQIDKLVHVSSIAALGRVVEGNIIDEKVKWENSKNKSYYSYTKFLSEKEVWRGIAEGLNSIVVNPALILGAGNWQNDSSGLFSRVWKGLPFYPTGMNGFVDVQDVVTAMIRLMNSNIANEQFVISGNNLTYKKVFSEIAANFKKKPPRIAVNRILGSLAWRAAAAKAMLTKKEPLITKETVRTSSKVFKYDNRKIKEAIDIEFTPIEATVRNICEKFQGKTGSAAF